MPLYEYRCADCGERFEVLQRMGEGAQSLACPRCGAGRPERQLSTFAAAAAGPGATETCGRGACGASGGFT